MQEHLRASGTMERWATKRLSRRWEAFLGWCMRKMSWLPVLFVLLSMPVAAALMGFARPAPAIVAPASDLHRAKLAFSYLTPEQVADLWKRADRYAEAEAFLKKCGQPSHIERRMWQAAGPCIEEEALRKVATYFRAKVLQFGQQKQFVCTTAEAKKVLELRPCQDQLGRRGSARYVRGLHHLLTGTIC